ncbi:CKLF-like MARVEL transmembrane domain-containing protein 6 [Genypterus blacodes]|uniref:CKLF-like MARVEL transmembrane domain-containing protein 6 n=1 Tax=Genypterus blacodes TaxID=154954 RepID=UPI003F76F2F5
MASSDVYKSTTVPEPRASFLLVPSENLEKLRVLIKILQVLLSLVAFVLEEVVNSCFSCSALYFFEFISCTAFLFTLLLLILLFTTLRTKVGITCWPQVDFIYTAVIFIFFLIASIVFAADNTKTSLELSAVAFGFLASFAFLVDLLFFWKSQGLPFRGGRSPEPSREPGAGALAESQKLNTPDNNTQ